MSYRSTKPTTDCVMNSERGALVRRSIPPSGHSVHNTAGDMWRTPARRLIQRYLFNDVYKTDDSNSQSLPDGKNRSDLGEERRTPRATSRLLGHVSTWYFRCRHLRSLALPDTKRVGRGFLPCRDRRSIVTWAVCISVVTTFNVKVQVLPRAAAWTRQHGFPVLPIAAATTSSRVHPQILVAYHVYMTW